MLSQSSANNTAVEENLRRIRDTIKDLDSLLILLVVVIFKGQHPSFDFLYVFIRMGVYVGKAIRLELWPTCFKDIVFEQTVRLWKDTWSGLRLYR